nr:thioredoxin family protein [Rhodothermus marinus]
MNWLEDLDAALAEARRTRRPVWLMFVREGCAGCARMEAVTYRDPRVQVELREAFVLLRQDIRRDRIVRARYAAVWTPSFYVLDARGMAHHSSWAICRPTIYAWCFDWDAPRNWCRAGSTPRPLPCWKKRWRCFQIIRWPHRSCSGGPWPVT